MSYGYYIAASRKRYGDPLLARMARLIWRKRGHRNPSRVCGASIWETPMGYEVTVIIRDLFGDASTSYPPYPAFPIPRIYVRK